MEQEVPQCRFCEKPAEYQIGYAQFDSREIQEMVGYVSAECVEQAIENVMQHLFRTTAWATVHSLDGQLLYHSYDADKAGYSAVGGWKHMKEL
ncbi:MAG: hypothetical protein AAFP00_01135 [Bacteroidota bacterium]